MFEVGFTEIILILGIALVVLGPEKLPKVAADIGRWVGRARAMARQFKAQLDEEVVKADRDWTKPAPPKPKPKSRSAVEDVDVSPNRSEPPPAAPADAGAAADGATPAEQATHEPKKKQADPGTDSP
jgi:sec-independent protein translocase protein TatB